MSERQKKVLLVVFYVYAGLAITNHVLDLVGLIAYALGRR